MGSTAAPTTVFRRYVALAVVGRNVHRLGAILLTQEAEAQRRRRRKRAA